MLGLAKNGVRQFWRSARYVSTEATGGPPLLGRLRNDLKTAMQLKDKSRLKVIRSILSDVTLADKGPSPVETDISILSLLQKKIASSKKASEEFCQAHRDDLKKQQDEEIDYLQEYVDMVETLPQDEVLKAVEETYKEFGAAEKVTTGAMMKKILSDEGRLSGKPVQKADVAKAVQDVLEGKKQ